MNTVVYQPNTSFLIHHNTMNTAHIIPASLKIAILLPEAAIRVSRVALFDRLLPKLLKVSVCKCQMSAISSIFFILPSLGQAYAQEITM
jgi:hypothetical protein